MKVDLKKLGTTLLIIYAVFMTFVFWGAPSTESFEACQNMGLELDALLVVVSEDYIAFDESITDLVDGNISEDKFTTLYDGFTANYEDIAEKYEEVINTYNSSCYGID
ncbi:hypothetical protein ACFL18_02180 [Patescibacteria group bacterium]